MAEPPPHEPTFRAAKVIKAMRANPTRFHLAETGRKPTGVPNSLMGVGPKHVAYLRKLGRDLSVYCDIVLGKRAKGREVEHVSPETDAYRAEVTRRRYGHKP